MTEGFSDGALRPQENSRARSTSEGRRRPGEYSSETMRWMRTSATRSTAPVGFGMAFATCLTTWSVKFRVTSERFRAQYNPMLRIDHQEIHNGDGWWLSLRRTFHSEKLDPDKDPLLIIPGYGMNSFIFGFPPQRDLHGGGPRPTRLRSLVRRPA